MSSINFGPSYRSRAEEIADFLEVARPLQTGELLTSVVEHYIGPEKLIVRNDQSDSGWPSFNVPLEHLFVAWSSDGDEDIGLLPTHLAQEFCRLRILSWLKQEKRFDSPMHFYMVHYLLSVDPLAALPQFDDVPEALEQLYTPGITFHIQALLHATHPAYPLHGLETVVLDLEAPAYISMFKAGIPPFDQQEAHVDTHLYGAASLLQHCKHLKVRFGYNYRLCDAWNCIPDQLWGQEAGERRDTCTMGKIIDWILEYAWANQYLQHLETVTLQGDIQEWVREKWDRIFEEWKQVKEQGLNKPKAGGDTNTSAEAGNDTQSGIVKWQDIHTPNIEAIESHGMRWGETYDPEEHYPPVCKCDTPCSKIGRVFPRLSDLDIWPDTKEAKAEPAEEEERELPEWETRAPGMDNIEWETNKEEEAAKEDENGILYGDPTINVRDYEEDQEEEIE